MSPGTPTAETGSAVWGQEKELLRNAGADLGLSSPCHHLGMEVTAGRTTSSPSCSLTQGWPSPWCNLATDTCPSCSGGDPQPRRFLPQPRRAPTGAWRAGTEQRPPCSVPYLRDLILGLLQLVGFVCPQQPGLHLPLLLEHGLGILPPLPGLHALIKGSLEGRRGRGLLTKGTLEVLDQS